MKKQLEILAHQSTRNCLRLLTLSTLAGGLTLFAAPFEPQHEHALDVRPAPSRLVDAVRNATSQFADVNMAVAAGYQPLFGCVSGSDQGAMGIHYVNLSLYGGGKIDVTRPQALIYEPSSNGLMTLVGVEFFVDAATWLASNPATPSLMGQSFLLVNSPNRYNIPSHFELHVWAWRDSPNGAFVDWNTRVSCEGQ